MHLKKLAVSQEERFQPDPDYTCPAHQNYFASQEILAALVGSVAIGLPIVILVSACLEGTLRHSISHYYYAPIVGDLFVGSLVFVGAVMIAFRGGNLYEQLLATLAGIAALGVALFPTSGAGHSPGSFAARVLIQAQLDPEEPVKIAPRAVTGCYFELFDWSATVHVVTAGILFALLAFFCFWVFTRVVPERDLVKPGELTPAKRRRNLIYRLSGCVIVAACILLVSRSFWDVHRWNGLRLTFWCEAAMLWAFGSSWLVKGRFWGLTYRGSPGSGGGDASPPQPSSGS